MRISNKLFTGNYDTYQNKVELSGRLNHFVNNNDKMLYWGANYSSNKETFANQVIAFDNSNNMGYTNVNENGEFYIYLNMPNGYIYKGNYVPPSINLKMINSNDYATVDLSEEKVVNHIPCENKLCDVNCPYCQSAQEQLYRESNQKYNYGTPYFDSNEKYVYLPGVNAGREGFQNPTTTSEIDRLNAVRVAELKKDMVYNTNNTCEKCNIYCDPNSRTLPTNSCNTDHPCWNCPHCNHENPKALSCPTITAEAKIDNIGNLNNVEGGIGYYNNSTEIKKMGKDNDYSDDVIKVLIHIWARYRELQKIDKSKNIIVSDWTKRISKLTGEQLLKLNNDEQKKDLRIGIIPPQSYILSEVQYMRDLWLQIRNRQKYLDHTDCAICNIQCNPDTRTLNSDKVCSDNHPCNNCPYCRKTNQVALQLRKCPKITSEATLVGTGAATERKELRKDYVSNLNSIQATERQELCGDSDIGTAGYLCLQKIQNETAKKCPYLCSPAKWENDGLPCNDHKDPKCVNNGGCVEKCRCHNSNKYNSDCNACLMKLAGY